jgi:hypothetical protein
MRATLQGENRAIRGSEENLTFTKWMKKPNNRKVDMSRLDISPDYKIKVTKSPTADTRSCDCTKVTKKQLGYSSQKHIEDVDRALHFFELCLVRGRSMHASYNGAPFGLFHDYDKLEDLDGFHRDFIASKEKSFIDGEWYKNHLKVNRHHLNATPGTPDDVNLIDVLEHIADCAVAGMARSGEVYPIELPDKLLQSAVKNTLKLILSKIEVTEL